MITEEWCPLCSNDMEFEVCRFCGYDLGEDEDEEEEPDPLQWGDDDLEPLDEEIEDEIYDAIDE